MNRALRMMLLASLLAGGLMAARTARAEGEAKYQVYGFAMLDAGYGTEAVDPTWYDTMRPSKMASKTDEFGKEGQSYLSVRQSRLGVKSWVPTSMGELKTQFEFDMYGVGKDAGLTTIRPRVFYGELGHFGAGQIASAFMDLDVFPNCLDYWGPNGMLFLRNPQIRWMPVMGDKQLTIALEQPGASGDAGIYADRVELANLRPSFPVPDLSGNLHVKQKWGYVQAGGIVRKIKWQDLSATATKDISGDVTGWGATLSGNLARGTENVLRFQVTHGEGIENYFNDAPIDVGSEPNGNPPNPVTPVTGKALPITGFSVFVDHTWNQKFASTAGYSQVDIDNSAGQAANAYKMGQYALANILYMPVPNVMAGFELGWEKRKNNADFNVDLMHFQVSAKYNFALNLGGGR